MQRLLAERMPEMFLLTRQMKFNWFPASRVATVASLFVGASQLATTHVTVMHATEAVTQQVVESILVIAACVTELLASRAAIAASGTLGNCSVSATEFRQV
ncbi:MAG: hypothetical protein ACR2N1_22130, partial [Rubripirellula sp.]